MKRSPADNIRYTPFATSRFFIQKARHLQTLVYPDRWAQAGKATKIEPLTS